MKTVMKRAVISIVCGVCLLLTGAGIYCAFASPAPGGTTFELGSWRWFLGHNAGNLSIEYWHDPAGDVTLFDVPPSGANIPTVRPLEVFRTWGIKIHRHRLAGISFSHGDLSFLRAQGAPLTGQHRPLTATWMLLFIPAHILIYAAVVPLTVGLWITVRILRRRRDAVGFPVDVEKT